MEIVTQALLNPLFNDITLKQIAFMTDTYL